MTPAPSATTAQPLPPLNPPPPPGGGASSSASPLASFISGIGPIKRSVDAIQGACREIVRSGAIPGSEQVCGQIVALASTLIPMAAQNMLQPGMGGPGVGGPNGPGGGPSPMPPPPGGPQPLMGGGGQ